jgi:excisionase family DNA binding protein
MELLSVKEAASILRVSTDTVKRLIEERYIQSEQLKPRGWHRIRRDVLDAYIKQRGLTTKEPQDQEKS